MLSAELQFRTVFATVYKKTLCENRAFEAVEKLSFFEQPLDRNHAFDRMLKKNRVLRTQFFFPCIKTEVHKVNCRIAAREGGLDHAPRFL